MTLNKEQIIERGLALGVDYSSDAQLLRPTSAGLACGRCDACRIRRSAFERLGLSDPITYVTQSELTSSSFSPVDPLVRRVIELVFFLAQMPVVAATDEVDA